MIDSLTTHYLYLNPNKLNQSLDLISPVNLIVNSAESAGTIENGKKVYKIEYDFNDGTDKIVKKLYSRPLITDFSLPWPTEIGDPRNYPISKKLILSESSDKVFNIKIKVFYFDYLAETNTSTYDYNITLNLKLPSLSDDTSQSVKTNFFDKIHLHSVNLFGADNYTMLNFESESPNYLLPVVVKWN